MSALFCENAPLICPKSVKSAVHILAVFVGARGMSGFIAAKGGGPGFNLWGSFKLPSLQTSKLPQKASPGDRGSLFGAWRGADYSSESE